MNTQHTDYLSKCCNTAYLSVCSDEGTCHARCTKCGKACDLVDTQHTKEVTVEDVIKKLPNRIKNDPLWENWFKQFVLTAKKQESDRIIQLAKNYEGTGQAADFFTDEVVIRVDQLESITKIHPPNSSTED